MVTVAVATAKLVLGGTVMRLGLLFRLEPETRQKRRGMHTNMQKKVPVTTPPTIPPILTVAAKISY